MAAKDRQLKMYQSTSSLHSPQSSGGAEVPSLLFFFITLKSMSLECEPSSEQVPSLIFFFITLKPRVE